MGLIVFSLFLHSITVQLFSLFVSEHLFYFRSLIFVVIFAASGDHQGEVRQGAFLKGVLQGQSAESPRHGWQRHCTTTVSPPSNLACHAHSSWSISQSNLYITMQLSFHNHHPQLTPFRPCSPPLFPETEFVAPPVHSQPRLLIVGTLRSINFKPGGAPASGSVTRCWPRGGAPCSLPPGSRWWSSTG